MQTSLRKPILLTVLLLVALVIILVILANTAMQENRGVMNLFSIVIMLALIALVWFRYVQEKNFGPATPEVPVEMKAQPVTVAERVTVETPPVAHVTTDVPEQKSEEHAHTKHEEKNSGVRSETSTGKTCIRSGNYVCSEHPDHTVEMTEGKRFPPCRGDGTGHSATWVLAGDEGPSVDPSSATRTGHVCVASGTYVCSEHPDKVVEMTEGKRFPPCRGDGAGHSALWILQA
jgi:hypothetical protein